MVDASISKKRFLAIVVATVAILIAAATPAYAFYYVHGDEAAESQSKGAMEILCTVDNTANGGSVWTGLIFIPDGGTPADAVREMLMTSESQQGQAALHDYSYQSIEKLIAGGQWTCTVYAAESQKPGTQTERDSSGTQVTDLKSATLQRYDSVVFIAE